MSKRNPFNLSENPSWTGLYLGDCGQHLKTGECPVVSGFSKTFGGAAYYSKPLAVISGDSGGPFASGFYGYGLINKYGYVTDLEIVDSGWHYTQNPIILFSGKFHSGVGGSYQNFDCSGKAWDDPHCVCSGEGLVLGYKIYDNVTKIPPQCSTLYNDEDWPSKLDGLSECDADDLQNFAKTDNYGRCKTPNGAYSGICVTSWASGWNGDCSDGAWKKSDNHCSDKGSYAPRGRCVGSWFGGFPYFQNGPAVPQTWNESDQYLDWGVCKKRGYKNVVAMKAWHGEPPFTSKARCLPALSGDTPYTTKYLSAQGTWRYDMKWSDAGTYHCNAHGGVDGNMDFSASVDQRSSKVTENETLSIIAKNNVFEIPSLAMGVLQFENCTPSFLGYYSGLTVDPGDPTKEWNICTYTSGEDGVIHGGKCVSTTLEVHETGYIFIQTISLFNQTLPQHDLVFNSTETITVNLSDEYDYKALNSDVNTLLNQWNLLDDVIYPWKLNEPYIMVPKVTYAEGGPTSPLIGLVSTANSDCVNQKPLCKYSYTAYGATINWDDCTARPEWPQMPTGWTDCAGQQDIMTCNYSTTNACAANCKQDGRIIGGPALVGHFGTIDFNRENREDLCCSCSCDTYNADLIKSWGGQSPLHHVTQWPSLVESNMIYYGGFASINDSSNSMSTCSSSNNVLSIGNDILMKGKWAEIIQMDKPSRNFRMPCGIGNSGDWTLINNQDTSVLGESSNAYTGNCVSQCKSGLLNSGTTYSCYANTGEGTQKERWPQFGLSGNACSTIIEVISGVSTTSGASISLSGLFTGEIGDYVNGYFTLGNAAIFSAGVFQIVDIPSPTGLTISGVFPMVNDYLSGWIDVAQNEDWFDNRPKGDFVVRYWNYPTFAGEGTTGRNNLNHYLGNQVAYGKGVAWAPCDPSIALIVPSGSIEASTSGQFGRNASFTIMGDLTPASFGARFHYVVQQWMTDPMWTPPSKPCCLVNPPDRSDCQPKDNDDTSASNITHTWEEDDGSCVLSWDETLLTDNGGLNITRHHFYPMRPFVEATTYSLGPFAFPSNTCAFPTSEMATMTGACWTMANIENLTTGTYQFISQLFNGNLCPVCETPWAGVDYWGKYAPWLVSSKQEACLNEAWPKTDTNPVNPRE